MWTCHVDVVHTRIIQARLHLSDLFLPLDLRRLLLDFFARRPMKFLEGNLEVNQK